MARPLTKCDQGGLLYFRQPTVEAQINLALTQDLYVLRGRLAITDHSSPDHLSSETIVHLIRDARRRVDQIMMNALLPVLLKRCEANLIRRIPDEEIPAAPDIREEVLSQFSELIADDEVGDNPNELDFFECRFNLAFRNFRIGVFRKELARLNLIVPLPVRLEGDSAESEDDAFARLADAIRVAPEQERNHFMKELRKAIDALPKDERKAVVLCHVIGYEVESADPDKVTAATLCGVTGRTIRNRLSRAAVMLSRFKQEARL